MVTKEFAIEGMSCMHCVKRVEMELKELNPAEMKVEIGKAEVTYDENQFGEADFIKAIEEAGYKVKKQ